MTDPSRRSRAAVAKLMAEALRQAKAEPDARRPNQPQFKPGDSVRLNNALPILRIYLPADNTVLVDLSQGELGEVTAVGQFPGGEHFPGGSPCIVVRWDSAPSLPLGLPPEWLLRVPAWLRQ